jgi:CBS domain-containing protein
MKLLELLASERVVVPLAATSLKDAALELAETLVESGVATEPDELRELVGGALPREVVPVGQAFLLHYRTESVSDHAVALGVAKKPVRSEGGEKKESRIVILLVAPPRESNAHLRALSAFARALSRHEVVDAILSAKKPEDILEDEAFTDLTLPTYLSVRDVMVRRRLSVQPDAPLGEAARLMVAHEVIALPVVSETDEVLGVITHQELLRNLLPMYVKRLSSGEFRQAPRGGEGITDPHTLPVRDVMDRTVLCISEDQTLADVATMMLNRDIERFPVVSEGKLVGFLDRGDIVRRLLGR